MTVEVSDGGPTASPVWDAFTDIQADAVRATAVRHLRDPEELAAELAYLFTGEPTPVAVEEPVRPMDAPTVVFQDNVVAEPVWTLLGTTESGSGLYVRPAASADFGVNDPLTQTGAP